MTTGTERRGVGGAAADMGRSLGLVLLAVVVVLLVGPSRQLLWPSHPRHVQTVTYDGQVRAARELSAHPMPAPAGLPGSWRPTSARVEGGHGSAVHLHIGFITPSGTYAGVEESDGPPRDFLETQLGHEAAGTVDRTVVVGGQRWEVRTAANGETALTRVVGGTVVVVTGNAGDAELSALAASLQGG